MVPMTYSKPPHQRHAVVLNGVAENAGLSIAQCALHGQLDRQRSCGMFRTFCSYQISSQTKKNPEQKMGSLPNRDIPVTPMPVPILVITKSHYNVLLLFQPETYGCLIKIWLIFRIVTIIYLNNKHSTKTITIRVQLQQLNPHMPI